MMRLVKRALPAAGLLLLAGTLLAAAPPSSGATPENPYLTEARRLKAQGQLPASADAYARYLQADPGAWQIRFELAQVLMTMRDLNGAELQLQKALLAAPRQAPLWSRLGQVYLLKDDQEHAEESLVKAQELDPNNPGVRYNLALLYEKQERHQEAFMEYLAFLDLGGPDDLVRTATRKVAKYLEEIHRPDEAVEYYKELLAKMPKVPWVHQKVADLLYTMARYDDALAEYRVVLSMKPDNAPAHLNVGFIEKMKGNLDEAQREFTLAVSLEPDSAKAQYQLGTVLFEKKDYQGAADCFEKTIAEDPMHPQAHYFYARTLMKLGRPEEAQKQIEIHKEVQKKIEEKAPSTTMERQSGDG